MTSVRDKSGPARILSSRQATDSFANAAPVPDALAAALARRRIYETGALSADPRGTTDLPSAEYRR
jgi:hypothetical protein